MPVSSKTDKPAVRASGGLVVRGTAKKPKIAVVHRPRYDDWTIPKGKADSGEKAGETALREVEEETGLVCRIVGPAGVNRYRVGAGLKQVDYFLMRPYRSVGLVPNDEVDELRWLTPKKAAKLLSHEFDRNLATSFDIAAATAHTDVHLVRHAAAGDRATWKGPDEKRPLTSKGREQASAIESELADVGIGRILSSPYVRCRQTVQPLAEALGLEVEDHPALAEGAGARKVSDLLADVAGTTTVLCSHGDVIPTALEVLKRLGVDFRSPFDCKKASTWVIAHSAKSYTEATYIQPPA